MHTYVLWKGCFSVVESEADQAGDPAAGRRGLLRRLYDWVLHWAETPYGTPALFILAVAESSFFPIPPEPLLLALAFAIPARGLRYGIVASVGSVLGGAIGYGIGYALFEGVGRPIFELYGYMEPGGAYEQVAQVFRQYTFWAILAAAVSPIPYKVFTITAGAVEADLGTFLLASAIGRSARFCTEGLVVQIVGERARAFVERRFEQLTWAFVILLVLGFLAIKWLMPLLQGPGPAGP